MAIGSSKGNIRLYCKPDATKANVVLPGFGDPITGLDITGDGTWVLATCPKYLLLIPTKGSAEGKIAFNSRVPKDQMSPLRLALQPLDIQRYHLDQEVFTYATFNTGSASGCEEAIISSVGMYIIMWNLRQVKRGKLESYTLKQAESKIVVNQFKFDNPDHVLITTQQNVKVERRRKRGPKSP